MRIDEHLAGRLVDSQFPEWAHLPIAPVESDGWDNRTFRLGPDLTLRLPSGDWYALQVEKEQRWLPILAPRLPLPIPLPVAQGEPAEGYPYAWSVYRWLDGEIATEPGIGDLTRFASTLAGFLVALQAIDADGGPGPGRHNFFRGGPLAAVIDFGTCGVGDPACDVVIAWTLLSGASRDAYRAALGADAGTWSRGRGWALWKALISLVGSLDQGDVAGAAVHRRTIDRVLADHARDA